MAKIFKNVPIVLLILVLMLGLSACQSGGAGALRALDGSDMNLADFKGKPVLLHFWSVSEPARRAQLADLEELYQTAKGSALEIVTVNVGDDFDTVKSFVNRKGYHFRVLLDSDKELSKSYGVNTAPATYFLNKDSKIASNKIGILNNEELFQYLKEIVNLGKKPGDNVHFDYFKGVIRVTAYGFAPKDTNGAAVKLMARRGALAVAQKDLLNAVQNFALLEKKNLNDGVMKLKVDGALNNVTVVSENFLAQKGVYEVVIEAPLYGGSESHAAFVLSQLLSSESTLKEAPSEGADIKENYTGVIIDARSLCIRPYINPKIIDSEGSVLYSLATVEISKAAKSGLVGYAKGIDDAKEQIRIGNSPLIIKAADRSDELKGSVVISRADAQRLKAIDKKNNIFGKCAIVFVVD